MEEQCIVLLRSKSFPRLSNQQFFTQDPFWIREASGSSSSHLYYSQSIGPICSSFTSALLRRNERCQFFLLYIGSLHPRDETVFYKEPTSVTPNQDYSSHHFLGLNTSKPTTVVRGSKVLRIQPNFPPESARQNFGMIPLNHPYKKFSR
jgi:hypothetical protein